MRILRLPFGWLKWILALVCLAVMVSAFHVWSSHRKAPSAETAAGLPPVSLSTPARLNVSQGSASGNAADLVKVSGPADPAKRATPPPQFGPPFPATARQNNAVVT